MSMIFIIIFYANSGFSQLVPNSLNDLDNDGILNHLDLDSDGDGIPDIIECPNSQPSGIVGFLPDSDVSFSISGDPADIHDEIYLHSVTIDGKVYEDFLAPSDFSIHAPSASVNDVELVDNGSNSGIKLSNPNYEQLALPYYQDRNLNNYQRVDKGIDDDEYVALTFSPVVRSGAGAFALVTERGGNNTASLEAFDSNGNSLGSKVTINANSQYYLETTHLQNSHQDVRIAILPIDNLAPVGAEISTIRYYFAHSATNDEGDGKIFLFGDRNQATCDFDNDGIPNHLDIDSDNDGIPDNIEFQGTYNYVEPTGIDANGNGIDDAYEGLEPIDTDEDGIPDYLDIDSDNDGILDIEENGFTTNTLIGVDSDADGLDDAFDMTDDSAGTFTPHDFRFPLAEHYGDLDYDMPDGDLDFRDVNRTASQNDINIAYANHSVSGNILTNDFDEEGHTIFVDSLWNNNQWFAIGVVSSVFDDNNNLAGEIEFQVDGSYVFIPETDYEGCLSIHYKMKDEYSATSKAMLNIKVIPFEESYKIECVKDNDRLCVFQTISGNILYNDINTLGMPLEVSQLSYEHASGTATIPVGTSTSIYDMQSKYLGDILIESDGSYTFTADEYVGKFDIFYHAIDENNVESNSVLSIKVLDAPSKNRTIANDDVAFSSNAKPLIINVLDNDVDAQMHDQVVTKINGQAFSGSITISTTGGSLDMNSDGSGTFTPDNDFTGTIAIPYQIRDNGMIEAEDRATLYILVSPFVSVLPVEMSYFNAYVNDCEVELTWGTESETNNSHFEIQRSVDGVNFETISKVEGNGTTLEPVDYTYVDQSASNGVNYYRIVQVDYDEQTTTSDMVQARVNCNTQTMHPNPVFKGEMITISNDSIINQVQIFSFNGSLISSTPYNSKQVQIDTSNLSSGTYIVIVNQTQKHKLVVN